MLINQGIYICFLRHFLLVIPFDLHQVAQVISCTETEMVYNMDILDTVVKAERRSEKVILILTHIIRDLRIFQKYIPVYITVFIAMPSYRSSR